MFSPNGHEQQEQPLSVPVTGGKCRSILINFDTSFIGMNDGNKGRGEIHDNIY